MIQKDFDLLGFAKTFAIFTCIKKYIETEDPSYIYTCKKVLPIDNISEFEEKSPRMSQNENTDKLEASQTSLF